MIAIAVDPPVQNDLGPGVTFSQLSAGMGSFQFLEVDQQTFMELCCLF